MDSPLGGDALLLRADGRRAPLAAEVAATAGPSAADYEPNDTRTSLAMGVLSLAAPFVAPKVFGPLISGRGRFGKALVLTAGAVAVTTIADRLARWEHDWEHDDAGPDEREGVEATVGAAAEPRRAQRRRIGRAAERPPSVGVTAVAAGGVALTTTWGSRLTMERLWQRRLLPDLGTGPRRRRRHPRMGLHLLLEPPVHAQEPVHVGDPRGAPLERALQPVHRAAPAGRRRRSPAPYGLLACSASGRS